MDNEVTYSTVNKGSVFNVFNIRVRIMLYCVLNAFIKYFKNKVWLIY